MRAVWLAGSLLALAPMSAAAQSSLPTPVETQQLQSLDAWSVSALARGQGALDADLWAHSDGATVGALFARLPAIYDSPSAQRLAQRALFSGGAAPSGAAVDAARERFEALGRMGAADQLATMAAGAPDALRDPTIAQFAAQAELARGRRPEACARGRGATVDDPPPIFLVRLRAYCSAVTGDRAAADLALEMNHGAAADDAWYRAALAAAAGAPGARPPAARYDNSLATQISIAAHLRPAATALNTASTLAMLALARSDDAPQPQRLQATVIALRRAALPPNEARAILAATPETVTTGAPATLAVWRQVSGSPDSVEAAAAIAGLLRQAATPADFTATARLFRTEINALRTAPDAPGAMLLARAALMNGDAQDAQRMIASARQGGANEATLAPLDAATAALVEPRGADGAMAMKRRVDAGGASMARAAARDVTLLAALGAQPDEATQAFLAANTTTGGVPADAATMTALADAAQRRAVGEVALLAALAIHPRSGRLDAASLAQVIGALRTVGLESDARRLTAEAILAGVPAAPTRRAPAAARTRPRPN
jgi:hypothetical protein